MDIEVQKNRALEDELSNLKKIYRGSRDEELNVMEKTLPVLQGRIEELETDSRINKRDADDAKNLAKKLIDENIELKTVVNKLLSSPNSNSNQNEQKSSSPLQAQQPTNQELPKMSTQPSSSNEKAQNEQYSFQIAQMLGNFAQFEREVRNREEAFRRAVADRDSEIERLRFELAKNLDSMPVPQRIPVESNCCPSSSQNYKWQFKNLCWSRRKNRQRE
jgi:membrane-bound lytic murein transglycosylase